MAAKVEKLGNLHDKVAEVLTRGLDGTSVPTGEYDDDGNEVLHHMEPSAAVITACIQFLKNNNITCQASDDNALGALEEKMRQREEKRKARQVTRIDLSEASKDMAFITGLPN